MSFCNNVIIVDANYIDKVAFNLIVNFERMLERRIQPADMGHWLDCVALDGGMKPGDNKVQVIFLYDKSSELENFKPCRLEEDLNAHAFKSSLGEFSLEVHKVESQFTNISDYFVESLEVLLDDKGVEKIIVVPDAETYSRKVVNALSGTDKDITLLAMEPLTGGGFKQQILGYSLMSALNIRADELRFDTI